MPIKKFRNWIVYKAQHKFLVSVLGIITNEAGQIMLLKHGYRSVPWGIPGGWMELEKPEAALEREIYEETKLKVEITGLAKALFGQNPTRVDLVFRGRLLGGTFSRSAEISEIIFCDIGDWPEGMPNEQKKLIQEIIEKGG